MTHYFPLETVHLFADNFACILIESKPPKIIKIKQYGDFCTLWKGRQVKNEGFLALPLSSFFHERQAIMTEFLAFLRAAFCVFSASLPSHSNSGLSLSLSLSLSVSYNQKSQYHTRRRNKAKLCLVSKKPVPRASPKYVNCKKILI